MTGEWEGGGVPGWPDVALYEVGLRIVPFGQVMNIAPRSIPVDPHEPIWFVTTTFETWSNSMVRTMLNSLGGAKHPLILPTWSSVPADGTWAVTAFSKSERFLNATVTPRTDIDNPTTGQLVTLGTGTTTRLYEVAGATGNVLDLVPNVLPPDGTNQLTPGKTVKCRMLNPEQTNWGVYNVPMDQHRGTTVQWVEDLLDG